MVGNSDATPFSENLFISGTGDPQAEEKPAEGCQDVKEQDDR